MKRLEDKTDYASQLYQVHNNGGRVFKANAGTTRKNVLFNFYRRRLIELCMNRFVWEGLPDTVDVRYLEVQLLMNGLAIFYFDEEFDRFLCLGGAGTGVNMYDNPTKFIVQGATMVHKTLEPSECVPIWANYTRSSDMDIINIYANRLAEADRTTEINMISQRHPFILSGNVNEKLSLTNIFKKLQDGEPAILGTDHLSSLIGDGKIDVLDLNLPNGTLTENLDVKTRIWGEALTLLGIMNSNTTKKERLVEDEANGASGQVLGMRAIHMNSRTEAVIQINDRFGLDISVKWGLDETNDDLGFVNLGSVI